MVVVTCAGAAIAAVLIWSLVRQQGQPDEASAEADAEADTEELAIESVFAFRRPPAPEAKVVGVGGLFTVCRAAPTAEGIERAASSSRAVVSQEPDGAGKPTIRNPLEKLGRQELEQLQSVSIHAWSDGVARSLRKLDLRRICVAVGRSWLEGLPEDTAMLVVGLPHSQGPVIGLSRFTDLRYLRIEAWYSEGEPKPRTIVDVATLNAPGLEYLRIAGEIRNAQAMARLKSLRQLELTDATGIDRLEFARELAELEGLSVRKVQDLRPLAGLGRLTSVHAYASDVTELPGVAMPALRLLDVLSSPVADDQVERFARLNPQCRIRHRYATELQEALTGATEVRVLQHDETIRVVRSPTEVSALLAALRIQEPELRVSRMGGHIRCVPETVFEVVTPTATRRVAPVGPGYLRLIAPGEDDPVASQWPADARLKPDRRAALAQWLKQHGVEGRCCGE